MEVKAGYKQTELGLIPHEWDVKRLGDVATIRDGTHQTPKYVASGVPFYSVENVTSGDFSNTKFISEQEHRFLTRTNKIEKGDVLMTRIGSIGDCKLIDWDVDASFYVSLALLKVFGASADFLTQYSKFKKFKTEIEIHSLQSAIPKKINLGPISDVRIILPQPHEQKAIAEALSDADALIESLEKLIEKKRQIKQGAMQELLTGKKRLPGFSGEWEEKSIAQISGDEKSIVDGPFGSNLVSRDYKKEGVPVLQGLNITNDKFVWKDVRYISSEKAKELYRSNAVIGDLLSVKIGSVGYTGIINYLENNSFAIIPANLLRIRVDPKKSNPIFLYWLLVSNEGKKKLKDLAGNTAQPAIGLAGFRKLSFCVPQDLNEQIAIAGILSDMDLELEELDLKLTKARQIKQGMMQELLTGRIRLV